MAKKTPRKKPAKKTPRPPSKRAVRAGLMRDARAAVAQQRKALARLIRTLTVQLRAARARLKRAQRKVSGSNAALAKRAKDALSDDVCAGVVAAPAPRRKAARKVPASPPALPVIPRGEEQLAPFAEEVLRVAHLPRVARFHDRAFIRSVYDQGDWGVPFERFQARLLDAHRKELVRLSRADLVGAMDVNMVEASATPYLGAVFHFIAIQPEQQKPAPKKRARAPTLGMGAKQLRKKNPTGSSSFDIWGPTKGGTIGRVERYLATEPEARAAAIERSVADPAGLYTVVETSFAEGERPRYAVRNGVVGDVEVYPDHVPTQPAQPTSPDYDPNDYRSFAQRVLRVARTTPGRPLSDGDHDPTRAPIRDVFHAGAPWFLEDRYQRDPWVAFVQHMRVAAGQGLLKLTRWDMAGDFGQERERSAMHLGPGATVHLVALD